MALTAFFIIATIIVAAGIVSRRQKTPHASACLKELSLYIRKVETPAKSEVSNILQRHGLNIEQAKEVSRQLPPTIKRGGNSRDDTMEVMQIVRVAIADLEAGGN